MQNTTGRDFPYLTTIEVGELKSCPGRTVQKACQNGLLPYIYIGNEGKGRGLYLIHKDDVDKWTPGLQQSTNLMSWLMKGIL